MSSCDDELIIPCPDWAKPDLTRILCARNGFFAFESALLFRPLSSTASPLGIRQWNANETWKHSYSVNLNQKCFFAEDVFGVQFVIGAHSIESFDPETAAFQEVAATLEEWAGWLLDDTKRTTGWPFAHLWQMRHGSLPPGTRLAPKVPFVLGGSFDIESLYALAELEGMRFRGALANQIANSPDGTELIIRTRKAPESPDQTCG